MIKKFIKQKINQLNVARKSSQELIMLGCRFNSHTTGHIFLIYKCGLAAARDTQKNL